MRNNAIVAVLVVAGLVVGAVPAAALLSGTGGTAPASAATPDGANNSSVDVGVGQQLSTVLSVTEEETQAEVEETAFSVSLDSGNESARAEAIAERAQELRERAQDIREDYQEATAAYEEGELSRSAYAHRLALLNSRATTLVNAFERLQQRAGNVSALALRAAGYEGRDLEAAVSNLSEVTGVGASALLQRFTGESEGDVEVETEGGLSIEVESEDGERSREFERPRDGDLNFTVAQGSALETARSVLTETEGRWVLERSTVHEYHGTYRFEFRLVGANQTGEAEVAVDASSGQVVRLEEEIQDLNDEGDDEDGEDADGEDADGENAGADASGSELTLLITEGAPNPGATVSVQVLDDGQPVEGATVRLNDRVVGTTNADGEVRVTLPSSGDAELSATVGDREAELDLEFGEDEDEEIRRNLDATGSVSGDRVTVTVTYAGDGVEGATVYVDGRAVGTTDESGSLTFQANATEDLEVDIVKGEFEATLHFEVVDGSLSLTATDVQGDDADDGDDGDESEDGDGDDGTDGDSTEAEDSGDGSDGDSTDGDSTDGDGSDGDGSDGDSTSTETSTDLDSTDGTETEVEDEGDGDGS